MIRPLDVSIDEEKVLKTIFFISTVQIDNTVLQHKVDITIGMMVVDTFRIILVSESVMIEHFHKVN